MKLGLLLVHGTSSLEVGASVSHVGQELPKVAGALCFSYVLSNDSGESLRHISHLISVLLPAFHLEADPTVSFSEVCRLAQRSSHVPGLEVPVACLWGCSGV